MSFKSISIRLVASSILLITDLVAQTADLASIDALIEEQSRQTIVLKWLDSNGQYLDTSGPGRFAREGPYGAPVLEPLFLPPDSELSGAAAIGSLPSGEARFGSRVDVLKNSHYLPSIGRIEAKVPHLKARGPARSLVVSLGLVNDGEGLARATFDFSGAILQLVQTSENRAELFVLDPKETGRSSRRTTGVVILGDSFTGEIRSSPLQINLNEKTSTWSLTQGSQVLLESLKLAEGSDGQLSVNVDGESAYGIVSGLRKRLTGTKRMSSLEREDWKRRKAEVAEQILGSRQDEKNDLEGGEKSKAQN